jgi:hypothetical protein
MANPDRLQGRLLWATGVTIAAAIIVSVIAAQQKKAAQIFDRRGWPTGEFGPVDYSSLWVVVVIAAVALLCIAAVTVRAYRRGDL